VVQAHGLILEGRMAVGQGRMPCVPRFGEEAEVREAEALYQGCIRCASQSRLVRKHAPMNLCNHQQRQDGADQG
jgi:hypothetical protein